MRTIYKITWFDITTDEDVKIKDVLKDSIKSRLTKINNIGYILKEDDDGIALVNVDTSGEECDVTFIPHGCITKRKKVGVIL